MACRFQGEKRDRESWLSFLRQRAEAHLEEKLADLHLLLFRRQVAEIVALQDRGRGLRDHLKGPFQPWKERKGGAQDFVALDQVRERFLQPSRVQRSLHANPAESAIRRLFPAGT